MQLTFGRRTSWLDDHTAAENITSAKAASKHARIVSEAFARPSQVSATLRYAAFTVGCLGELERSELLFVLGLRRDGVIRGLAHGILLNGSAAERNRAS